MMYAVSSARMIIIAILLHDRMRAMTLLLIHVCCFRAADESYSLGLAALRDDAESYI